MASSLRPILMALPILGCAMTPDPQSPIASGTFEGVTAADAPVVLTLAQDGPAVRGHGTIGGAPVALAGVQTWTAVGTLFHESGGFAPHTLALAADGSTLALEAPGEEPTILSRRGGAPSSPPGPFNGRYAGEGLESALADVVIMQRAALLAGPGIVLGQPVGIAGRATSADRAEGVLTFADDSQVRFEAELAADGGAITVRGLGDPVRLRRR